MKRTPIRDRVLPAYTRAEEIANMTTHIIGGALGLAVLTLALVISARRGDVWGVATGAVYGFSMIALYTVSSVYHGLGPCLGKKVMQAVDHCTIYFLIAGTYTPILLVGIRPTYPLLAWLVFAAEWALALAAGVFTAVDHTKFRKLSMTCYIVMGWLVVLVLRPALDALGTAGFLWLLAGGVAYTVGAILYGVGKKRSVFHTVFHVFVVLGSVLQAVCVLAYVLA